MFEGSHRLLYFNLNLFVFAVMVHCHPFVIKHSDNLESSFLSGLAQSEVNATHEVSASANMATLALNRQSPELCCKLNC